MVQSGNGKEGGPGRTDEMNKTNANSSNVKSPGVGSRGPKEKSVGDALRAVYHEAIDERVPESMLDLLSKLD